MIKYSNEIQNVVNSALNELRQEHASGKAVNAPVANNHYLVRWVTKAIKAQSFNNCVAKDLIRWQKQGRSKGNSAGLMFEFERISAFYGKFLPMDQEDAIIKDSQINEFIDFMEENHWEVTTSEPLVGVGKVQFFMDGQNSLALCTNQCDDCFDGEEMVKPMSWFVRGNHAEFVRLATDAGFMVHKVTDYKSNVKYHGEYQIFPANRGTWLAEIPIGFTAE